MGFKITKDNVHSEVEYRQWSEVGKTFGNYNEGKHKFRLLDDDSEIYFYGFSDDDSSFEPLDWSMGLWGCTEIQYLNPITNKYETL